LSRNHLTIVDTNVIYPLPKPMPRNPPNPKYKSHRLSIDTAKTDNIKPDAKNTVEIKPDAFGPLASTKCPINAADVPKKNIAILKISETSLKLQPTLS